MKNKKANIVAVLASLLFVGCSTTKYIPEGDQLYVGLDKIKYVAQQRDDHFMATRDELEAALACAPNGALLGSSYYRTPFPYSLWIWNAFSTSTSPLAKWVAKSFGKRPVLMSWVNPALRASVGQLVLQSHGYFRGTVQYETLTQSNPKQAKIGYQINFGPLFTLDSISYENFPASADSLLAATRTARKIKRGDAFDASALEAERTRISNLFRNNGYYYYQPGYASYLADTLRVPTKVQLKFQLADSVPARALRKWYIGRVDLNLRKQFMEPLSNAMEVKKIQVHFNGKRSPIRPRIILHDLQLRPNEVFSYDKYMESSDKISSNGLFSFVDFQFTPRDSTAQCDTLDLALNCLFDKKYDVYVETNYSGRTSGRMGPGLVLGFTKRNAFRGGEKLDINLKGSYEWQTGHTPSGASDRTHTYEYGGDASLEIPRFIFPGMLHHRHFYTVPTTLLKASSVVVRRGGYFKRHIVSGELTYTFQTSATSMHQWTPLSIEYAYMSSRTPQFVSLLASTPYLQVSMRDQFIPRFRYSYLYTSPKQLYNPIWFQVTASEAGNMLSLGYMVAGKGWSTKDKEMFKNPYAQFLKLEAEYRKTWRVADKSQLVAHVGAGIIWSYGNSSGAPWSEQFYVGGANSVRAFTTRSVGPGSFLPTSATVSYLDQTGDLKLLGNLEYRPRLFGKLYGAVFLDAGNVWILHEDVHRPGGKFKLQNALRELALGTGIGLRYDLDFFVLRIDWGVGLHVPFKNGFYNISHFRDAQSLHFAIGLPF